jgi:hypothetical protein
MCYEIAYPDLPKNGVTITGIDIPFLDLVALLFKLTLAWVPIAIVIALVYGAFAAACYGVRR